MVRARLKKPFLLLVSICLFFSISLASSAADSVTFINSEEEFLNSIQNSEEFIKYKNLLVDDKPRVLKPTRDENNVNVGYLAQFELKYNYENQGAVKLNSLLSFVYTRSDNTTNVAIIDYSDVMNSDDVYIINVKTNEKEVGFSVEDNKTIQEMKVALAAEAKELEESGQSTINSNLRCWVCTKTEYYEGNLDDRCSGIIGTTCKFIGKTIFTKLICQSSIAVACYVPSYTICVDGLWSSQCPSPYSS